MIPLTRRSAARRLETTLVSCSRQALPRPARLYSTPSKRANGPALATPAPSEEYPPFMPAAGSSQERTAAQVEMEGFLRRRTPYTILPTPLPDDQSSALNDFYFTDSPTQDQLSVMDACLHGLYDVPRAKHIFERLLDSGKGEALLDARVYNSLLAAYLDMASSKETRDGSAWLEEAWALYDAMESERDKVRPTANTYALMLLAWLRFHSESAQTAVSTRANVQDPTSLLRCIIDRQIPVTMVVSDRAFTTSEEASEVIQALSKAAVEMGLPKVVNELGMAESLGREHVDPLEDVPEAIPVMRAKVNKYLVGLSVY